MTWAPPANARETAPGEYETPDGRAYVSEETWARWDAERCGTEEDRARREREQEYENYRLSAEDRRKLRGQRLAQDVVSRLQTENRLLRWYVEKLEHELWRDGWGVALSQLEPLVLVRCMALGLSLAGVQDEREGEVGQ
jgi:hypothetical protein